jgi:hypothetical protein
MTVIGQTPAHDDPIKRLAPGDAVTLNWPSSAGRLLPAPAATGDEA